MEEGLGKRVRETDALTSRVTKEQRGSSTALGGSAKDSVTKENLRWYYDNRFPIRQMFTWVSYGGDEKLSAKREYCATIRTDEDAKNDVFVRYQRCTSPEDLRKLLVDKFLLKLDIGPVYNHDVRLHKSIAFDPINGKGFVPEEKELVFDIDMDEYDDVRTCCSGKQVCIKCWRLLSCAAKIINRALRDDFGFKHILFVFSGRRGIHCWVADKSARLLTNMGREAIASYIAVAVHNLDSLSHRDFEHPALKKAFTVLDQDLPIILADQGILHEDSRATQRNALIDKFVKDEDAKKILYSCMQKTDRVDWRAFKDNVESLTKSKGTRGSTELMTHVYRMAFYYAYPRLDIEVSKQTNHLLKAPFCIHPDTGKVCVPIDVATVDSFDPNKVPTLQDLLEEKLPPTSGGRLAIEGSVVWPYIRYFNEFVRKAILDEKKPNRGSSIMNDDGTLDF